MTGSFKIIKSVLIIGISLAFMGLLANCACYFGKQAVEAHQRGGIKFKTLNKIFSN